MIEAGEAQASPPVLSSKSEEGVGQEKLQPRGDGSCPICSASERKHACLPFLLLSYREGREREAKTCSVKRDSSKEKNNRRI